MGMNSLRSTDPLPYAEQCVCLLQLCSEYCAFGNWFLAEHDACGMRELQESDRVPVVVSPA